MAQVTIIVKGIFYDGIDSSMDTIPNNVAKKIQDVIDAADSVEFISIFHKGNCIVATITYTEPA